ncbi:MAG: hypothetical protein J5I59_13240 [Saprospiraceae bacterium]|nr:hypothetical protein [Saprospiraceae bacterium]
MNRVICLLILIGSFNLSSCSLLNPKRSSYFKIGKNDINFSQIFIKFDTIYFPAGTYYINQLIIPDNKTVITDGFNTIFKSSATNPNTPAILINGSNVKLGKLSVVGNINNASGEWNHAVAVITNSKDIKNVEILGIRAKDIRGDGLYIGSSIKGGIPSAIVASDIEVDNCYRNGVSIVSGYNIKIRNVKVENAGLFGFDIECNPGSLPLKDIQLNNYIGGPIGIIGDDILVSNVKMNSICVDGNKKGSNPSYPIKTMDGLTFRQCSKIKIDSLSIMNFERWGINSICEKGEILINEVYLSQVQIQNVATKNNDYNSYINLMGFKKLQILGLKASIPSNRSLFLGNDNPQENSQVVKLINADVDGGYLARYCQLEGDNLRLKNMHYVSQKLHPGSFIKNSKITCENVDSGSKSLRIVNSKIDYKNSFCPDCDKRSLKSNQIKQVK